MPSSLLLFHIANGLKGNLISVFSPQEERNCKRSFGQKLGHKALIIILLNSFPVENNFRSCWHSDCESTEINLVFALLCDGKK